MVSFPQYKRMAPFNTLFFFLKIEKNFLEKARQSRLAEPSPKKVNRKLIFDGKDEAFEAGKGKKVIEEKEKIKKQNEAYKIIGQLLLLEMNCLEFKLKGKMKGEMEKECENALLKIYAAKRRIELDIENGLFAFELNKLYICNYF